MAPNQQPNSPGCRPIPTIRRLTARHILFKMAFYGLFLSLVIFVTGFSGPGWLNKTGLWKLNNCRAYVVATMILEILSLLSLLCCVCFALYQDVLNTPPPPENKAVEVFAILSGLLGLSGVTVFGVSYTRRVSDYYPTYYYDVWWRYYTLEWAFVLAAVASSLALLCGVTIALSRVLHAKHTTEKMAAKGIYLIPARVVYIPPNTTSSPPPSGPPPPPPPPQGGVDQRGVYPSISNYTAPLYLPSSSSFSTHMMTSQIPSAPPTSEMNVVSQGATSQQPCSPTRSNTAGIVTSSLPVCYVVNEGKTIPVYEEIPEVIVTAAP